MITLQINPLSSVSSKEWGIILTDYSSPQMCCISISMFYPDGVYLGRSYLSLDHMSCCDDIKLPVVNETDTFVGILNCKYQIIRYLEVP